MDGKGFEKLIQDSCHINGIDCVRLRDAGYRGEQTERRFTIKNICDFIIFNGEKVFKVEVKKRKSSCRFDELTQLSSLIKEFERVCDYEISEKVAEVFIVYFESLGSAFVIYATMIDELKSMCGKKSFNTKDLEILSDEHPAFCYELEFYIPKRRRKLYLNMNGLS